MTGAPTSAEMVSIAANPAISAVLVTNSHVRTAHPVVLKGSESSTSLQAWPF